MEKYVEKFYLSYLSAKGEEEEKERGASVPLRRLLSFGR